MIIQYYGHSCFKITTKPAGRGKDDVAVFFDPFDKSVGLRSPQGQADLVLVSHNHADHNNVEALKGEVLRGVLEKATRAAGITCSRAGANPPWREELERV